MMRAFSIKFLFALLAAFSLSFAPVQFDELSSGYANVYASDSDGDGVSDVDDAFPNDPSEQGDMDHDGSGDNSDQDRDGDGDNNDIDPDPNNPNIGIDTIPPVVITPAPVTIEATGAGNTVVLGLATATDNVSPIVTLTNDAPAVFPVGTTIVTYTATDAAGNVTITTQTVTVVDTTPPVITAPAAITASSGDNLPVTVPTGTATATDLFAVTITNNAPITFPVGITTVTWTATDANGNSATATQLITVNLVDITAPVVAAPLAVTIEATGTLTTALLGTASATDVVDSVLIPTNDAPIAGFPVGVTTVTYTATDIAGNIGTATQLVTVTDTTAPVITALAAITVSSGDNLPVAVLTGTATATDLFAVTISSDAPATFPVGITTVIWTATDANGNSATATQLVTVNLVDVTAPVVTAPLAVTVEATGTLTTALLGTASATDVVDGPLVPVSDAPVSFPVGITTVTYSATDAAGNIGTATQLVTITDTTAPVITAPAAITASSGDNLPVTVPTGTATATDLFAVTISSDAPVTFPVGVTTITWTATDANGNSATATQLVTVNLVDVTAPVVTAPLAVTVEATGAATAVTLGTASATDVVDGVLIPTNDAPIAGFPVGVATVTYSATDVAGNVGSATQLVTVTDTTAPVIIAPAAIIASSGDNLPVTVLIGTATATDLFAVTITSDAPATFPVGVTIVTWTATDANGNSATATQLVTVNLVDVTAPVVTAPLAVTIEATGTLTTALLGTASATDAVDGIIIPTNNAPASFPVGTTVVTYSATDAAGNIGTATQTVTVTDTIAPVITAPAAITASSGDNLPVTVLTGTATATDLFAVTLTNNAPATFPVGITTVTWTATDANGNSAIAAQLITVNLVDVTAPVVTAPIAVTAEATGAATAVILGTASATDIVDGIIITTNDAPIGGFPVGVTTITYSGTDLAGNIGTATQTVTITDTIAPIITAPAGVTADSINGADPVVNIGQATATDLFAVTISNDAPAIFPVGATTVTWTATDANGNSSAATQLVTINLIDTLPPVITVPANVSASTSTSQATVNIGIASANDNIDGIVAVTNNAPATYPVGVSTVIYTASDNAGNTATGTQQVYVSFSSTVGGGTGGGTTTPPAIGGGATVGIETIYFHHNDHLGTPQAMTDINGTKVWEMSQTPFGIATVNEDPDGDGLLVVNNFRFPGQYFDAETGLYYNYFRSYNPKGGNYPQHDPIGLDGGLNTFGYVGGNPMVGIDPFGLKLIKVSWLNLTYNYLDDSVEPLVRTFKDEAKKCGINVIFTEAFRPSKYQTDLSKNPTAITPATAGTSLHEAGFAIDLSWRRVQKDKRNLLIKIAKKTGLGWGGGFSNPDPVHFYKEVPGGRSKRGVYIKAAQEAYTNGIK